MDTAAMIRDGRRTRSGADRPETGGWKSAESESEDSGADGDETNDDVEAQDRGGAE